MSRMNWQGVLGPFREFEREFARVFQSLQPLAEGGLRNQALFPPLNVFDNGREFIVRVEAPGLSPKDIELGITGEVLVLQGERPRFETIAEESYRRLERPFGRWSRSVSLPETVRAQDVTAEYSQGVLTIVLPKAEDASPRQIPVERAKDPISNNT